MRSLVDGAPLGGQVSVLGHSTLGVCRWGNSERWHEGTRCVTKEGGRKGQKETGRDLVTKTLKKKHQNMIGFEGRNLVDFFFFEISLLFCIIQIFYNKKFFYIILKNPVSLNF